MSFGQFGVNCLPDAENCSDAASFLTMLRFLIPRQLEILNNTTADARASCYCDTNEIDFGRAERKKDRGVRPTYKHDRHLEFLEVRRVSGDYLRERNQSIIRSPSCLLPPPPSPPPLPLSFSFPFPLCSESPFYWLFARWKLSSRCTHYRYLRPADHHHQLIPYRRRSSPARGRFSFFFLLKKQRRHSSLAPRLNCIDRDDE